MNLGIKNKIQKYDTENVYGSVVELSKQVGHAWDDANKVEVPDHYRDIRNVVMCGMGGSGLGARVIESVYSKSLSMPLVRVNDYHLPGFTDEHTLVVCSSYSGETEETIANANASKKKNAKWMAIARSGKLIEMAKESGVPYYQIDPKYNPSNQPRMAIGYSIIGQLALAAKTDLFSIDGRAINKIVKAMEKIVRECEISHSDGNPSFQMAKKIQNNIVVFVSARHLVGAAHVVNNQQNENAKNLCFDVVIPELNHHLMEGLKFPKQIKNNVVFIFIESDLYPTRIRQRFAITEDVVSKNGIRSYIFKPRSKNKLTQAFEVIQFGAFVNFYLSMLHKIDPAPIPWVDYFKKELGQPLGK